MRRTHALLVMLVLRAALPALAGPAVELTVRASGDGADLLVERRLDWRALHLDPAHVCALAGGRPLPSQAEPDRILFRLPGLTRAGSVRRVVVQRGTPRAVAGGIRVTESGGTVSVENGVLTAAHVPAKNGGLPSSYRFGPTGRTEDAFVYNDRVYDQKSGRMCNLSADKQPRIRVLSRGPLAATVQVTARYLAPDGSAPASAPRATYRFRYAAGSPLIRIEARMEQKPAFAWSELHFLEFNTHVLSFPRWQVGNPDSSGTFTDSKKGVAGSWGALFNDREAIGLRAGQVTVYDGYTGHGNYLHGDWVGWSTPSWYGAAWMYLGAADAGLASLKGALARADEGVQVTLSAPAVTQRLAALSRRAGRLRGARRALGAWHLGQARLSLRTAPSLARAGEEMDRVEKILSTGDEGKKRAAVEVTGNLLCAANAQMALAFERKGKAILLRSIYDVARGREFARPVEDAQGLWQAVFRPQTLAADKAVTVDASQAAGTWRTVETASGVDVHLAWHGVKLGDEEGAADVEAVVHVPNQGTHTEWRIRVVNRSQRLGLWTVAFPRLENLTVSREGALAVPMGWGQLYKDATRNGSYTGDYPNGWATMQFASLSDGGAGLYLAAHDGQAHHKQIQFVPHPESDTLTFAILQFPDAMAAPGKMYENPYPVVVAPHAGGWFEAAKTYRAWAMEHSTWFPRTPLARNPDTPEWLKQNPLWCSTGGDPKDVVPRVLRFQRYFGVPMAVHWYSWHQIPFDDHYPEYFPPKPGFAEAVAELKAAGVRVMPYINGRLFDSRTDTWKNDGAERFCALSDTGQKYVEEYGSGVKLSPMCPATEYWQEKISGIVERLIGECGVTGVYIDQIGAAGTALCFNPQHPHGAGGAESWVPGYRELLTRTRRKMRALSADSFLTTEDAAEPYQGKIDAFLMCNQTRGGLVPMYPAVYGGRALTFGRYIYDADAKASLPFITKVAEMFVFGAQLGWLDAFILDYPKEAGYLKRLAETRLAAARYLALGEMLHPPVVESDAPPVKTTWELWGGQHPIEFPAVMASAWRAEDGSIGLVMTNITDGGVEARWRCEGKSGTTAMEPLSARVVEVR